MLAFDNGGADPALTYSRLMADDESLPLVYPVKCQGQSINLDRGEMLPHLFV